MWVTGARPATTFRKSSPLLMLRELVELATVPAPATVNEVGTVPATEPLAPLEINL